jgi:hypothetical protein
VGGTEEKGTEANDVSEEPHLEDDWFQKCQSRACADDVDARSESRAAIEDEAPMRVGDESGRESDSRGEREVDDRFM